MPDEIRVEDLPPVWAVVDARNRILGLHEHHSWAKENRDRLDRIPFSHCGPYRVIKYAAVEVVQEGKPA